MSESCSSGDPSCLKRWLGQVTCLNYLGRSWTLWRHWRLERLGETLEILAYPRDDRLRIGIDVVFRAVSAERLEGRWIEDREGVKVQLQAGLAVNPRRGLPFGSLTSQNAISLQDLRAFPSPYWSFYHILGVNLKI